MPSILTRFQNGWNAFMGRDPTNINYQEIGYGSSIRPDKRYVRESDRNVISSVICRIGMDAAAIPLKHVRVDENDRYLETMKSALNETLTVSANIDQTGRAFIQDVVESMCEEGVVAIVPTETSQNPVLGSFDIGSFRVGKILEWYPRHVKVEVYNEWSGKRESILLEKKSVAIVQNPLYSVMNEPNSTLQRLKRTLSNLDIFNERNASGKLDLIIQLPYVIKTPARREQAEIRRKDIEMQLSGSKYGIAYTDGTERITQLNRPVENSYWAQAKDLTSMLYNQLGLTESVFDGTADEKTMTNYYNRTIEPILSAIADEMIRKFLTKTARSQGQTIKFYRDPFKLVTVETLASIADVFARNEVATSNELRTVIGWKPSDDPKADELRNSNMPQPTGDPNAMPAEDVEADPNQPASNEEMSDEEVDSMIDMLQKELDDLQRIKEERENSG